MDSLYKRPTGSHPPPTLLTSRRDASQLSEHEIWHHLPLSLTPIDAKLILLYGSVHILEYNLSQAYEGIIPAPSFLIPVISRKKS